MAEKIKRFRLKADADVSSVPESSHLSFIHKDAVRSVGETLLTSYFVVVYVGFPENLSEWNDFDFVLVLDDMFGQPYMPFYSYLNGENDGNSSLETVVKNYNKFMSSLPYLEEIK